MNVDLYSPGADVTAIATSPVLARRLVGIAGNRVDGNIAVAPAPAAGRAFGVAKDDTAAGALVSIARSAGRIVLIKAAARYAKINAEKDRS